MGSKPIGISASRGASILGLNDWQSQFEIWQIMKEELYPGFNAERGYTLPPPPDNAAIRWGSAFESAVISLAEIETGMIIKDREKYFERDKLTCHLDGIYNTGETIHEGKTTNIFSYTGNKKNMSKNEDGWGTPGTEYVPRRYQIQLQHQMYASDFDKAILSVLVFPKIQDEFEKLGWEIEYIESNDSIYFLKNGEDFTTPASWAQILWEMGYFHQYPVARKPDTINLMLDAYEDFWSRYIIGNEEPDPSTYDDVRRAFPEPVGTVVVDKELELWLSEYKANRQELGKSGPLSKRNEQLKTMILDKARKLDPPIDEESREKTIFMSQDGKKLGQFDGRSFR